LSRRLFSWQRQAAARQCQPQRSTLTFPVRIRDIEESRPKNSDYMKDNIYITTSGMAWEPAIRFAQPVMGSDHVSYEMDYSYQFDLAEIITTDKLSIRDHDRKLLYQLNAERLFSLADS
jgi:2,3-dihydroxybenzoate decarboxylase